jgi:hypothetical protein
MKIGLSLSPLLEVLDMLEFNDFRESAYVIV